MKLSLTKLLSVITGLLVVVLVAVFAILATTAFERQQDAAHILSIVTVKRDLLLAQEAVRQEGALLDTALEERDAADADTIAAISKTHARSSEVFAQMRNRRRTLPDGGTDEIFARSAEFNRLMPAILAAAALPREKRPPALSKSASGRRTSCWARWNANPIPCRARSHHPIR